MRCRSIPAEKKELNATLKKVLKDFGNQEAIKIAEALLEADDETTDEKIAEVTKIKLNIVRKILYILNENKLTEFRRVRDKRSGWFVYYWNENFDYLPQLLKERRQDVIEKLEIRLKFEDENYFFRCNQNCTTRHIMIDAMEYNFRCPECENGILEEERNADKVKYLKDSIVTLREEN